MVARLFASTILLVDVGVLQSVGAVAFGAEAAYGLVFVVMIAVLIWRPAGLLGKA